MAGFKVKINGSSGNNTGERFRIKSINYGTTQNAQAQKLSAPQILQQGLNQLHTVNAPAYRLAQRNVHKQTEYENADLDTLKSEIESYSGAINAYNNWKIPSLSENKEDGTRYTYDDVQAAKKARDDYFAKVTGGAAVDEISSLLKGKSAYYNKAYEAQLPSIQAEQFNEQWELDNYSEDKAKAGLETYYADKNTAKQKEENKQWWEKLGETLATVPSTDSPVNAAVTSARKAYEEDTSYREPNDEWDKTQWNIFGYLYSLNKNKAYEYAIQVNNSINKAKTDEEKQKIKESATSSFGAGAAHTVGAVLAAPLGLADLIDSAIEYSARGTTTNKNILTPHDYSETVTGAVSNKLNKWSGTLPDEIPIVGGKGVGDVYGLASSLLQSSLSAVTGSKAVTLISFFGSSASSAIKEAKERGVDDGQALLYGVAVGLAEAIPEMIAVDKLLGLKSADSIKGFFRKLNSQGFTEGLTEGTTAVLTQVSDNLINGDFSQYNLTKQEYIKQGLAETEASKKAWSDIAEGIAFDTLAGYAMGGIQAAPVVAAQTIKERKAEYQSAVANQSVLNLIEKVKNGAFKQSEKVYLENVSEEISNSIKQLTGIDVTGFKVAIEARQIEHILKDHGVNGAADQSMSNDLDIAKIEYVLKSPDNISNSGTTRAYVSNVNGKNKPAKTVLYEKSLGENSYYAVQAVPDTNAKTLYIVSAFIGKSGYKKETSQTTDANSPGATPNSGNASISSNNTVPQSEQTVNNNIPESGGENSLKAWYVNRLDTIDPQTVSGYNNDANVNQDNGGSNDATYQQGKMVGSSIQSEKGNTGMDSQSQRSRREIQRDFIRRTVEAGRTSHRQIHKVENSYIAYTPLDADETQASKAVEIFKGLGINAIYCDGKTESNVEDVTTDHFEAVTSPDGVVFVSNTTDLSAVEIVAHEMVHIHQRRSSRAYIEYGTVIYEKMQWGSDEHLTIALEIFNNHHRAIEEEKINKDIADEKLRRSLTEEEIENIVCSLDYMPQFLREFTAYVNEAITANLENTIVRFSKVFSDWDAVVEASRRFNEAIGLDFSEADADTTTAPSEDADNDTQSGTNAVTKPLSEYSEERQGIIKSFIGAVDEKLKSFVQSVKSGDLTFKRQKISDVSERAANDIGNLLGIDVSGYTHNINTSGVQHIINRHGANGQQDTTMSLDDDIARVGWVLENYDSVELLTEGGEQVHSSSFMDKDNNPAPQIRFTKKIDGTYYVVEAAFENDYKKLWVQSAYLQKNEDVTQASAVGNTTNHGANAQSALVSPSSNNTVPQSEQTVNNNIPENGGENSADTDTQSDGAAGVRMIDLPAISVKVQSFVKSVGKALGRNVEFVNMEKFLKEHDVNTEKLKIYPEGAIDGEGNIYLRYNAEKPVQFLFKHELTHFGERSKYYAKFVEVVRSSKVYLEWLKKTTKMEGASREVMEAELMKRHRKAQGELTTLGYDGAMAEIIADFVGEKCFGESLEDMNKLVASVKDVKERNAVVRFLHDFFLWLKNKLVSIGAIKNEISVIEQNFARMIADADNTKTPDTKDGGLKYIASDETVIDLSNDNKLSKAVEGLYGSARYTAIQNYILESLSEQPVMLSDGKHAVVDKRDALHMANKSGQEKTSHISAIKRIVETASLVAEENSEKNGKFDYFYYYEVAVKYNGDTYPIYLNVGRARNDGVYHLYDITKKLRDTAHRVNDVGRPVGNALKNGISNNNIPNSDENVNNNSQEDKLKFSVTTATESDTDTENTDFTAAFKGLMQSFQNGEINQDEYMRRVSELYQQSIDENGQISQGEVVEKYTESQYNDFGWVRANDVLTAAEYNTLLSRYADFEHNKDKYPTTRFGEAVIHSSECPDVIMYVKGSIESPQITKVVRILADEANVKELILKNERARYSQPFKAVEAYFGQWILDIDYKRDYASFRDYQAEQEGRSSQGGNTAGRAEPNRGGSSTEGERINSGNGGVNSLKFSVATAEQTDTATDFPTQQKELFEKQQKGEITQQEYMDGINSLWERAQEEYGTIPDGEMVTEQNKPYPTPKSVKEGTKVRQHVRTILKSGMATEGQEGILTEQILSGKLSYTPTSDEKRIKSAESNIEKLGYQVALDNWRRKNGKILTSDKNNVAEGEALLVLAFEHKNEADIVNLTAELAELGTRTAQNLQAMKLLKRMGGIAQLVYVQRCVAKINENLEKRFKRRKEKRGIPVPVVTLDSTLAQQLAESKTEAEYEITYEAIMQDIAAQVPPTFLDKFNAWRYMAMLMNVTTHVRNFLGNAIFLPAIRIKNVLGKVMELTQDKSKRTKSVVVKKEYKDFARQDFDEVKDIIAGGGKYNPSDSIEQYRRIFKTKWLEAARKFNFDLLEKEDMIFLRAHYTHALGGYLQAQGASLDNVSPEQMAKARAYAMQEALKATYRDASKVANVLSSLSHSSRVANVIVEGTMPFKKTPINIVKRGIEYSPVGLISTVGKGIDMLRGGEVTADQFIDGLAANLTGTGVFLLGMLLAGLGVAKGGFDDEEKWFRKLNGEQEYSIEIAGKSYTISWASPVCIPFFIGVAAMEYKADEDGDLLSCAADLALEGFEPLLELSCLSGINDTIENLKYATSGASIPELVGNAAGSYLSQLLPTIGGKVANLFDDTRRTTYIDKTSDVPEIAQEALDKIASKTPFASLSRAEYINAWGETQYTGNFIQRFFQQFVFPGYASTVNADDVSEELMRLYRQTDVSGLFPSTPQKYFKIRGERRDLSQEEYFDYATFRGQTQADLVDEAIHSEEYAALTDEQKAEVIKDIYSYAGALAKCQLDYTYEAVAAMEGEDTQGNLILTEEKYNRLSDKARQILIDEYFMESSGNVKAYKTAKNGRSVVEYFCKKVKE